MDLRTEFSAQQMDAAGSPLTPVLFGVCTRYQPLSTSCRGINVRRRACAGIAACARPHRVLVNITLRRRHTDAVTLAICSAVTGSPERRLGRRFPDLCCQSLVFGRKAGGNCTQPRYKRNCFTNGPFILFFRLKIRRELEDNKPPRL